LGGATISLSCDFKLLKVISVLFKHRFLEGNVPPGLLTLFKEFDTCVVHTLDGSSASLSGLRGKMVLKHKRSLFILKQNSVSFHFSSRQVLSQRDLACEAVSVAPYAAGRNKGCFGMRNDAFRLLEEGN